MRPRYFDIGGAVIRAATRNQLKTVAMILLNVRETRALAHEVAKAWRGEPNSVANRVTFDQFKAQCVYHTPLTMTVSSVLQEP